MSNLAVLRNEDSMSDPYSHADALLRHIEQREAQGEEGVRKQVTKSLRISASALSQYLGKKYLKGRPDKINAAAEEFLKEYAEKEYYAPARVDNLVKTEQITQGLELIAYAARHNSFTVLGGESGSGKTSSLLYYAGEHPGTIYMQLTPAESYMRGFVEFFFEHVPALWRGDPEEHWRKERTNRLKNKLVKHFQGGREVILIDEANYLRTPALEFIRSFQEAAKIGVVLCGTEKLDETLGFAKGRRFRAVNAQLHRRITKRKQMPADISRQDVAAMASLYAQTDDKAIAHLHQWCNLPGKRYGWLENILLECKRLLLDTGGHVITELAVNHVIRESGV